MDGGGSEKGVKGRGWVQTVRLNWGAWEEWEAWAGRVGARPACGRIWEGERGRGLSRCTGGPGNSRGPAWAVSAVPEVCGAALRRRSGGRHIGNTFWKGSGGAVGPRRENSHVNTVVSAASTLPSTSTSIGRLALLSQERQNLPGLCFRCARGFSAGNPVASPAPPRSYGSPRIGPS